MDRNILIDGTNKCKTKILDNQCNHVCSPPERRGAGTSISLED
jgi:hypothetical protein